jgi:hypothetical protein
VAVFAHRRLEGGSSGGMTASSAYAEVSVELVSVIQVTTTTTSDGPIFFSSTNDSARIRHSAR